MMWVPGTYWFSSREFQRCIDHALQRMLTSKPLGINHATTYDRKPALRLNEETIGVCAEYAFCRMFGIEYTWPINEFHRVPDCGGIEVRGTWREDGRLILRHNDSDERWYYLLTTLDNHGPWVLDRPPVMTLRGSIFGRNGKQDRFYTNPKDYRPAWFIPQMELLPSLKLHFAPDELKGMWQQ